MPRTTDDHKTHTLQMRVSPEFLELVDTWRKSQKGEPSRSEAIRCIVTKALKKRER